MYLMFIAGAPFAGVFDHMPNLPEKAHLNNVLYSIDSAVFTALIVE
jgi:hypothetical protein